MQSSSKVFLKISRYPTILESIKHDEDDEDDGRLESKVSPSHPFFGDSGPVFFSTQLCCLLGSQHPSARQCHAPWVVNPGSFSNTMLVETFGASQQTLSQRGQAAYLPPSSPDPVSEPVTVELLEAHLRLSKHRLDTRFILPSQPPRPKPRSAVESASALVSIWRRMAWLQDAST